MTLKYFIYIVGQVGSDRDKEQKFIFLVKYLNIDVKEGEHETSERIKKVLNVIIIVILY